MSATRDLNNLGKLIAAQHSWAATKAFKSYEMDEGQQTALIKTATDLLKIFPPLPGACALMSAALAVMLERQMDAPIHVVAGTLAVEGVPVFGDRKGFDGASVFASSDPDWDGHAWVMIGTYIVDISIFRTAYSGRAPARLAKHIDLVFGPGKGLYVDRWQKTSKLGLSYEPHYVLSAAEVTKLMGGAHEAIKQTQTT